MISIGDGMKNNKGFTLVELIAVIVVLAVLGLVAVPAINRTIKQTKNDLYDSQVTSIVDGVKNWVADHPRDLPAEAGEKVFVSLGQLKLGSYVDVNITNPRSDKYFDTAVRLVIEKNNVTNDKGEVIGDKYKYDCDYQYDDINQVLILNKYHCDFRNMNEESKEYELAYPIVEFNGNIVTYINQNEDYEEKGLKIDGDDCLTDKCNVEHYSLDIDSSNLNNTQPGSYYIKYTINNDQNNNKLVLYRTVIVK